MVNPTCTVQTRSVLVSWKKMRGVWIRGSPYYYANGIYYSSVPNTGQYVVVNPPPGHETVQPQPVPAQAPNVPSPASVSPQAAPAPSPPHTLFIYPRDGQSANGITGDRRECNAWATGQTGYDPSQSAPADTQSVGDFQRVIRACLEKKGCTVN